MLRSEDLTTSGSLAQDFGFVAVLDKRALAGYATVYLVLLWNQKTSQNPEVIKFSLFTYNFEKTNLTVNGD